MIPTPSLVSVEPSVILPYHQETLLIKGNFTPLTISKVIFNGNHRVDPVFTVHQNELYIEVPVLNPGQFLRVQLETVFGHGELTNSLFVRYVQHIQITEVSTQFIYLNIPTQQSIKVKSVLGFDASERYMCFLTPTSSDG